MKIGAEFARLWGWQDHFLKHTIRDMRQLIATFLLN